MLPMNTAIAAAVAPIPSMKMIVLWLTAALRRPPWSQRSLVFHDRLDLVLRQGIESRRYARWGGAAELWHEGETPPVDDRREVLRRGEVAYVPVPQGHSLVPRVGESPGRVFALTFVAVT